MDIAFKFDPEILIGDDTLSMAGTICSRYGERIFIAADHNLPSQTVNRLKEIIEDFGLEAIVFDGIEENAGSDMAENIVELSQAGHCNSIIAFGGRKTQIITRMAAIMAPMRISAYDLLEGRMFQNKFLPLVAIPTEGFDTFSLTEYFVASDPRNSLVKLINCPKDLYAAVILDNSLFNNLSASFLLDGFLSAIEAYCSSKTNFLADAILERSLTFFSKLIRGAGAGIDTSTYAQASFLAALGNAASSPGAGAALSYAINARFPVTKQKASAALLPYIAEKLVSARPEKMARVGGFLGAQKAASVAETANLAPAAIRKCMETLGVPADLKEFNIPLDRATAAMEAARNLEFVSYSPWTVSEEEIFDIIRKVI